jgi:hypothetical protein
MFESKAGFKFLSSCNYAVGPAFGLGESWTVIRHRLLVAGSCLHAPHHRLLFLMASDLFALCRFFSFFVAGAVYRQLIELHQHLMGFSLSSIITLVTHDTTSSMLGKPWIFGPTLPSLFPTLGRHVPTAFSRALELLRAGEGTKGEAAQAFWIKGDEVWVGFQPMLYG